MINPKEFRLYKKLTNHKNGGRVYWSVREKTLFGYKPNNSPWLYKDEEAIDVVEKSAYEHLLSLLVVTHELLKEHEKTKFKSDGSHFKVDQDIKDLMVDIGKVVD